MNLEEIERNWLEEFEAVQIWRWAINKSKIYSIDVAKTRICADS